MTATDVTGFDAIFSTGFFATFSRFWGARLTKLHRRTWRKKQKIQWRASSGDGAPKLQISVPCRGRTCPENLLCPPSRRFFVDFFLEFAWEFCIEKWRGFLVIFFWSPFPTKQSTKNSSKSSGKIRSEIRGKIRDENSKNSGNFRSATFLGDAPEQFKSRYV